MADSPRQPEGLSRAHVDIHRLPPSIYFPGPHCTQIFFRNHPSMGQAWAGGTDCAPSWGGLSWGSPLRRGSGGHVTHRKPVSTEAPLCCSHLWRGASRRGDRALCHSWETLLLSFAQSKVTMQDHLSKGRNKVPLKTLT